MSRIHKHLKSLFGLTKTEINGMLIFLPLTLILLLLPRIYKDHFGSSYDMYEKDQKALDSLLKSIELATIREDSLTQFPQVEYFVFNPNSVTQEQMTTMGIPRYIANRIVNYRNAGGRFWKKNDLKKIYGFSDSLFLTIEPYVRLPKREIPQVLSVPDKRVITLKDSSNAVNDRNALQKLDLASADTIQLQELRGIGPVFARRIVAYRTLLGGFTDISQLKEVYGISDSLFAALVPRLGVSDSIPLRRLAINLASFKELNRHPYVSYEQTKELLNSKSKYGKFRTIQDLYKLTSFDSAQIIKLAPYLNFR